MMLVFAEMISSVIFVSSVKQILFYEVEVGFCPYIWPEACLWVCHPKSKTLSGEEVSWGAISVEI